MKQVFISKLLFSLFLAILIVELGPLYWSQYVNHFDLVRTRNSSEVRAQDTSSTLNAVSKPENQFKKMSMGEVMQEAQKYKVDSFYSVVIPRIDAASNVIMNVDPYDKAAYKSALKKGVAHAKGSSFPGGRGQIYLFAHSTDSLVNVSRYNAVFYRLKDLYNGDKIIVYYAHRKYEYQVLEVRIVEADDLSWLEEKTSAERLLLQTCYPPGTTQKRLVVLAEPTLKKGH